MRIDQALGLIKRADQAVLRTADVMAILGVSKDYASHILSRLASSGHLLRLKQGVWLIDTKCELPAVAGWLTAPFPCYVSLQSALYHYGFISQIPSITYCVSLARTRRYNTPVGTVSIHHISEEFYYGFSTPGRTQTRIAEPEKAVLDFLYLNPAKSRIFASLPELDLSDGFSVRKAEMLIRRLSSKRKRTILSRKLEELLASST